MKEKGRISGLFHYCLILLHLLHIAQEHLLADGVEVERHHLLALAVRELDLVKVLLTGWVVGVLENRVILLLHVRESGEELAEFIEHRARASAFLGVSHHHRACPFLCLRGTTVVGDELLCIFHLAFGKQFLQLRDLLSDDRCEAILRCGPQADHILTRIDTNAAFLSRSIEWQHNKDQKWYGYFRELHK